MITQYRYMRFVSLKLHLPLDFAVTSDVTFAVASAVTFAICGYICCYICRVICPWFPRTPQALVDIAAARYYCDGASHFYDMVSVMCDWLGEWVWMCDWLVFDVCVWLLRGGGFDC